MNTLLRLGAAIVLFALVSYSVATFHQIRKRRVTDTVRCFLWLGIALDVVATGCMILGSSKGLITIHGLLGYSALALMALDTYWITRFQRKHGSEVLIPDHLQRYSIGAYSWWVLAFVAGAVMAMGKFGN
jgi:hypothetical protein